jgi:hypothetical protein
MNLLCGVSLPRFQQFGTGLLCVGDELGAGLGLAAWRMASTMKA